MSIDSADAPVQRTCVISLGVGGEPPPDHPEILFQDFSRGLARIREDLVTHDFKGEFVSWDGCYPEGSPTKQEAYGAFKPFCFHEANRKGFQLVLWMDASIKIKRPIEPLLDLIRTEGYLIFEETHSVGEYCKDEALEPLGITREESFELPCCWSCVLGLDLGNPRSMEFLRQWTEKARDGVTFPGPKWSGVKGWPATASVDPRVKGHRYDQTAASVIALKLGMNQWKPNEFFREYFKNDRLFVREFQEERSRTFREALSSAWAKMLHRLARNRTGKRTRGRTQQPPDPVQAKTEAKRT